MINKPFSHIRLDAPRPVETRRRYSVTSDVVAFRRCPRQYGAFRVDNFAPAHQTQIYYGTLVHQVLDRCHMHWHGAVDPATAETLPDGGLTLGRETIETWFGEVARARREGQDAPAAPSEVLGYLLDVEDGLRSHGIRPVSPDLRTKAALVLQNFNALEGPVLYPRVYDTEHRLQAAQETHVLHGVVDLLVNTAQGEEPSEREIWDYKGISPDRLTARDRRTYEFQMRVYARLYELRHGVLPRRAILYFVNELEADTPPPVRPANALMEVSLSRREVEAAIAGFDRTVAEIEACRGQGTWPAAEPGCISEQDCAICDLRWDCATPGGGAGVALRYP